MQLVKKIDIHAHTARVLGPKRRGGTNFALPEALLEMYDQLGVEKGVLLPLTSPEAVCTISTSEDLKEIAEKYPDRFYWFCCVDPRVANHHDHADFETILSYYKELGAKGVGELVANIYFDDERAFKLFAAAEKVGLPVLFHIGHTNGEYGLIDDLNLPRLEKALKTFPKLKFLGHSQRFWSHISADVTEETRHGWPSGPVIRGGIIPTFMEKYENLYCDLSAGSGFGAITRDPEFSFEFMERFQDRILYGIDICAPENITTPAMKLAKFLDDSVLSGKISYEAYLKISRDNALKLLGEK